MTFSAKPADSGIFPDTPDTARASVFELQRLLAPLADVISAPATDDARSVVRARCGEAERTIGDLLDQQRIMLFVADLVEGRFLWVNDEVSKVLGYPEKELLETSFLDRLHPEDRFATMREMGRLVTGKPTFGFRNRHRGADGSYRVFEWNAVADENRELCYAAAVDVTA